ncbi:MAG: hypothetical protein KAS36_06910 [Anaerolineales bacterium]|nr:hypothetical protein [Anaerolineales bacterium]
MFDKIKNSWNLMKASAAVLQADKELLIFPILSSIGVLILTAIFVFPMIAVGFFEDMLAENSQYVTYIVLFLFYVVQYTVIIFANSALVGAAMIRLKGGDPTVGDGFRIAFQHIGNILGYALLSATVGLILRMISERSGNLGRIAASLVGLAWNLATYLVVPVLVIEGVGPVEAIKRSAGLLKKIWGEQIVGNFSIGLIFVLVTVLVILLGIPFFILAISLESLALIIAFGVIFVLVLVFLGLINSSLTGIYVAAVYRYAAEGEASGFFDEEMIQGAFRLKE